MTDVAKYLEDLKGPSKNKRFDACYYLRRMKEIPEDAVLALQEAANDSDFLVAREARKALQAHSLPIKSSSHDPNISEDNPASRFLKIYGLLVLAGFVFSLLLFGPEIFGFLLAFLGGPILFLILVVGLIGYFVTLPNDNRVTDTIADKQDANVEHNNQPE
jgi:hypothetical protein